LRPRPLAISDTARLPRLIRIFAVSLGRFLFANLLFHFLTSVSIVLWSEEEEEEMVVVVAVEEEEEEEEEEAEDVEVEEEEEEEFDSLSSPLL
jgi:hypothetical protein